MSGAPGRYGRVRLAEFGLDPSLIHLNHGSYGAVPNVLAEAQDDWRRRIEANPSGFFWGELPPLLREGAEAAVREFGGEGEDWVFVENATQAANSVVAALRLQPGDHVLATSEIYNAVRQALHHNRGGEGPELKELPLPLPIGSDEEILKLFDAALRSETRAVFLDHVTSRSAIVLPVAKITHLVKKQGTAVFVDGAHAFGMLDVDVRAIGADWYAGNVHKWLYGPRGCGLLWTSPDWQGRTHPRTISHGYGSGYTAEFDWVGTRDVTPWLCFPQVLQWHGEQGGADLRRHCRQLAREMGQRLEAEVGAILAAGPDQMGTMVCARLPGESVTPAEERMREIFQATGTVFVLNRIGGADWLRVSAALYNELPDLDPLVAWLQKHDA